MARKPEKKLYKHSPKMEKMASAERPKTVKNSYKAVAEHLKDAEACLTRGLAGAVQKAEKEPGKWSKIMQQINKGIDALVELVKVCPEED